MKTFSVLSAAIEPFRLVASRPISTMAWGLVMLVPGLILIGALAPVIQEMAASGAFSPEALEASDPDVFPVGADMAAIMQLQLWSNLAQLLGLITVVIVTAAIIRGVYAGPKSERAFFLRIGMAELQVAVVGLTAGIGFIFVAIIAVLLALGIGFAVWQLEDPWRLPLCIALGIAVVVGMMLLWGRLSLLAPASIYYKTFAFEEGWKLGRGKTWSLFGLWIVLVLIGIAVSIAFMTVVLIVVVSVGGGLQITDPEAIEAWITSLPQRPFLLMGVAAVLLAPMAWLQGFSQTLFTAPFAHVVQARTGSDGPNAAVEELH